MGSFGAILGSFEAVWGLFGIIWGPFEAILASLGPILDLFGGIWGGVDRGNTAWQTWYPCVLGFILQEKHVSGNNLNASVNISVFSA